MEARTKSAQLLNSQRLDLLQDRIAQQIERDEWRSNVKLRLSSRDVSVMSRTRRHSDRSDIAALKQRLASRGPRYSVSTDRSSRSSITDLSDSHSTRRMSLLQCASFEILEDSEDSDSQEDEPVVVELSYQTLAEMAQQDSLNRQSTCYGKVDYQIRQCPAKIDRAISNSSCGSTAIPSTSSESQSLHTQLEDRRVAASSLFSRAFTRASKQI